MTNEFHDMLLEQLPRLRAYAMALTRNRAGADDLLQQTALKAWNAQAQFVAGTNFKAWLYQIMRNEHISTFRRTKRQSVPIDSLPEEFFAQDGHQENKLLTREVLKAMDQLHKSQREVLLMNAVGGLSYEEIAATLNCSMGTVKSRLWRARHEMHKLVYGTEDEAQGVEAGDNKRLELERREKAARGIKENDAAVTA
jgi:RNA polymerase sigma-70 factor (ECF subfamily)